MEDVRGERGEMEDVRGVGEMEDLRGETGRGKMEEVRGLG